MPLRIPRRSSLCHSTPCGLIRQPSVLGFGLLLAGALVPPFFPPTLESPAAFWLTDASAHEVSDTAALKPGRIVAIGDVHGDMKQLIRSLRHAGLLSADLGWSGGSTALVVPGDLLDRGDRAPEVLDLMMRLEGEAGGRVHVLLGNHEVMNLMGDWRYVSREEYRRFATPQSQALLNEKYASYSAFLKTRAARLGLDEPLLDGEHRRGWLEEHPVGFFERRAAFGPQGAYGRWLRSLDAALVQEGVMFVHGGLNEAQQFESIAALNDQIHREIARFDALWSSLSQADVIWSDLSWGEAVGLLRDEVGFWAALDSLPPARVSPQAKKGRPDARTMAEMQELLGHEQWSIASPTGPLWYRGMVEEGSELSGPAVTQILKRYAAVQVVVGHTPTEDRRIQRRLDGLVFAIDTGMSASFGGPASALEIVEGSFTALYPDGAPEILQDPLDTAYDAMHGLTQEEAEAFLRSAPVVEVRQISTGVTKPSRVALDDGRFRHKAAVQALHACEDVEQGPARMRERVCDSYKYNLAAYELGKLLGIETIPPTVERKFEDRKAAFTWWIDDVMTFGEMNEKKVNPPSGERWNRQQWAIGIFDELIYNTDRNQGNLLVDPEWRIWMIDHTRAFRTSLGPRNPAMLSKMKVEGELFEGLRKLSSASLESCCAAYLTSDERKALLARRDTILERLGPAPDSAAVRGSR
jgi:hypothetical protein